MKRMLSFLRRSAAMASLLLAMAVPATVYSADQSTPARVAPVPIQQVNFNSCPNGDCYNGGGWGGGWNRGWGGNCHGGNCHNGSCMGVGIFGCPCRHGLTNGYAFVRPPAVWTLNRTSNMYNFYYNARLAGAPAAVQQTGLQYPMVYQPTDTAQMGFYYQAVPRWYYRPEMLPPAPAPNWPLGMNGGMGYGYGWDSGAPVNGTTTAPSATTPNTTQPVTPAPVPPVAPPPPTEPQVNAPEPEATFFPDRIRRR